MFTFSRFSIKKNLLLILVWFSQLVFLRNMLADFQQKFIFYQIYT